jgi:hypothetical protein
MSNVEVKGQPPLAPQRASAYFEIR